MTRARRPAQPHVPTRHRPGIVRGEGAQPRSQLDLRFDDVLRVEQAAFSAGIAMPEPVPTRRAPCHRRRRRVGARARLGRRRRFPEEPVPPRSRARSVRSFARMHSLDVTWTHVSIEDPMPTEHWVELSSPPFETGLALGRRSRRSRAPLEIGRFVESVDAGATGADGAHAQGHQPEEPARRRRDAGRPRLGDVGGMMPLAEASRLDRPQPEPREPSSRSSPLCSMPSRRVRRRRAAPPRTRPALVRRPSRRLDVVRAAGTSSGASTVSERTLVPTLHCRTRRIRNGLRRLPETFRPRRARGAHLDERDHRHATECSSTPSRLARRRDRGARDGRPRADAGRRTQTMGLRPMRPSPTGSRPVELPAST